MKSNIRAFTLVEVLVVIAIIAFLLAILPAPHHVRKPAIKKMAQIEMRGLVTAIEAYEQAYGCFPVSPEVQAQAAANAGNKQSPDYTYGGTFSGTTVQTAGLFRTNAEVIAILMDFTLIPGTTMPTVNAEHTRNARQIKFLAARLTSDNTAHGVGPDLVYRDPWGNPYLISLDMNGDGLCRDAFYSRAAVSQNPPGTTYVQTGFNGLSNPNTNVSDNFLFVGKIMIWSAGPDGKIDPTLPANEGVNKDNLLSWQ